MPPSFPRYPFIASNLSPEGPHSSTHVPFDSPSSTESDSSRVISTPRQDLRALTSLRRSRHLLVLLWPWCREFQGVGRRAKCVCCHVSTPISVREEDAQNVGIQFVCSLCTRFTPRHGSVPSDFGYVSDNLIFIPDHFSSIFQASFSVLRRYSDFL